MEVRSKEILRVTDEGILAIKEANKSIDPFVSITVLHLLSHKVLSNITKKIRYRDADEFITNCGSIIVDVLNNKLLNIGVKDGKVSEEEMISIPFDKVAKKLEYFSKCMQSREKADNDKRKKNDKKIICVMKGDICAKEKKQEINRLLYENVKLLRDNIRFDILIGYAKGELVLENDEWNKGYTHLIFDVIWNNTEVDEQEEFLTKIQAQLSEDQHSRLIKTIEPAIDKDEDLGNLIIKVISKKSKEDQLNQLVA